MRTAPRPRIDKRDYTDILRLLLEEPLLIQGTEYRGLVEKFTPHWKIKEQKDLYRTHGQKDLGLVLCHLFSRLMEVLIERLNRVPDKHMVAFLDMLGVERLPGTPGRVPVTFLPAPKSPPGRFVPKGTQVATTQTEKADAVIFETEEGFDLTVVNLDKVVTVDPQEDRYRDLSAKIISRAGTAEPVLKASDQDEPVEHSLYMAHHSLFGNKTPLDLALSLDVTKGTKDPLSLSWESYDGKGWVALEEWTAKDILGAAIEKTEVFALPRVVIIEISQFGGTKEATLENQKAFWIRLKLKTPLTSGVKELPEVRQISVMPSVPTGRESLPDAAFTNTSPIDLNRDFFPFGEKPKGNDCFYISCEEALSPIEEGLSKRVTMKFRLSPIPGEEIQPFPDTKNITLTYEYWDEAEKGWKEIGQSSKTDGSTTVTGLIKDTTACFTRSGTVEEVQFDLPKNMGKKTVNAMEANWIRIRITGGNYGVEATAQFTFKDNKVETYTYVPATFKPPFLSITAFRIGTTIRADLAQPLVVSRSKSVNHFKIVDHSMANLGGAQGFKPFTGLWEHEENRPALYLGYSDTLQKSRISQFFHLQSEIAFGDSMNGDPAPQMGWEYSGGSGQWRRLDATDGTRNFVNSGIVVFTGPGDMAKTVKFNEEKYWLRLRLATGSLTAPRYLKGIYMNTMWAKNLRTIQNELLGSGTGEAGQELRLSQSPVLPGERILVREKDVPSSEELRVLEEEESAYAKKIGEKGKVVVVRSTKPTSADEEIWVRWYPVNNFLSSFPNSRHYVIDRVSGAITFGGDEKKGMPVPIDKGNIKAERYQAGGGAEANKAATVGAVKELKSSLPFVAKVTNYIAAAESGSDAESMDEVKERGPQTLKHRNRAVTVEDFTWLVRESSTRIALVKTLPITNAGGEKELGAVTVVIVPDSIEPRPFPSPELIDQVRNHLVSRSTGTISHRVYVTGPDYVKVSVYARVVPLKPEEASVVEGRVVTALETFLHPLSGGPDRQGWPFGRSVHISEIYAVIEDTEGVDYVLKAEFVESAEKEQVAVGPNQLVYSGTHQIVMGSR